MFELLDRLLHVDRELQMFVQTYGSEWVYGLLALIVFAETGFVVTPFLPGDSLLFAAGTLCGTGILSTPIVMVSLAAAAFAGNAVNYAIGRAVGPRIFSATDTTGLAHKLLNREHLAKAHEFFEKYGGKAVILGRFVPIVRTFVPFVAGAAQMTPASFVFYNAVGAVAWVVLCTGAGVLFGQIPIIKNNFSLVTIGIVFVSILPVVIEFLRHRRAARRPGL